MTVAEARGRLLDGLTVLALGVLCAGIALVVGIMTTARDYWLSYGALLGMAPLVHVLVGLWLLVRALSGLPREDLWVPTAVIWLTALPTWYLAYLCATHALGSTAGTWLGMVPTAVLVPAGALWTTLSAPHRRRLGRGR